MSRRKRLTSRERDRTECDARYEQPTERQSTRRQVVTRGADADERGRPQRDGEQGGAERKSSFALGWDVVGSLDRRHREVKPPPTCFCENASRVCCNPEWRYGWALEAIRGGVLDG